MVDAILFQISTSYIHNYVRSTDAQLGLYYIAEYANIHNINIKIKKYSSNEPIINSLETLLQVYSCSIIGFYVDSENLWTIRRILVYLKKTHPELFVIIGGPQVTGDPQLALKRIPYVNCAIVGEGERPVVEIIKQIKASNLDYAKIKGVCYLNEIGECCFTGSQIPVKNLDEYPYPKRKNYTLDDNVIFDQISTGRGCVGQCAFCFEGNKKENVLRLRSVENVIEEIDYVISNLDGHRYITFLDDTFIINPNRTELICNHLINKYNGEIAWFCEARVDILIKNLHLLPMMKRAGLVRVQLGGESGNQKVLNAYNKNMQIEQLIAVIKEVYKAGIPSIYINYIIGGALETLETFNDTIELAKLILTHAPGCVDIGASLLSPYVGTPIRENPDYYDIKILDKDLLRGPDGFIPAVETGELTECKILQLKAIFDKEILKTTNELLRGLSNEEILIHFNMKRDFSIETNWYNVCVGIEPFKNFFEAISYHDFYSFIHLSKEELQVSVPHRTCQPVSDGECYWRNIASVKFVKNNDLENAVFLLSSGKICFYEIVQILSRTERFKYIDNLESAIIDIYTQFDKERLVVWKKSL